MQDEESGIESISCTIYDATLRFNVWTTTHSAQRVPRAHTDPIRPEQPDEAPDTHDNPEREERVCDMLLRASVYSRLVLSRCNRFLLKGILSRVQATMLQCVVCPYATFSC